MAKRSYTRNTNKMTKIQPAVETLTFDLGTVGVASAGPGEVPTYRTYYIDLSQCASLANRRFYRQGLNWMTAGMRLTSTAFLAGVVYPSAPIGSISINKIPNTWVMSNAWEKGFRAWSRMNREALTETPSVRPKFLDFKVYADFKHAQSGIPNNSLPSTQTDPTNGVLGFTAATAGEWEASKFVIPNSANPGFSTEQEILAVGGSYPGLGQSGLNSVSLIEGYAASRGLPDILDPNTPEDSASVDGAQPQNFLQALFNEGTNQDEQVIEDMISENNTAPYPFENGPDPSNPLVPFADTQYPNGVNQLVGLQSHVLENITGSTIGGVTYLRGGNYPCGLIRIDIGNADGTYEMKNILQIDLVPGTHRGYLCEPMTEM